MKLKLDEGTVQAIHNAKGIHTCAGWICERKFAKTLAIISEIAYASPMHIIISNDELVEKGVDLEALKSLTKMAVVTGFVSNTATLITGVDSFIVDDVRIREIDLADPKGFDYENKPPVYYVYECLLDGKPIYVGKGIDERYKHCTSGKSSCKGLNELVASGANDRMEIRFFARNLTEKNALRVETVLIDAYGKMYDLLNTRRFKVVNQILGMEP